MLGPWKENSLIEVAKREDGNLSKSLVNDSGQIIYVDPQEFASFIGIKSSDILIVKRKMNDNNFELTGLVNRSGP